MFFLLGFQTENPKILDKGIPGAAGEFEFCRIGMCNNRSSTLQMHRNTNTVSVPNPDYFGIQKNRTSPADSVLFLIVRNPNAKLTCLYHNFLPLLCLG